VTGNAVLEACRLLKARLDAGERPPLRVEHTYVPPATKAHQTEKLAQDNDFPLKCTVEPL